MGCENELVRDGHMGLVCEGGNLWVKERGKKCVWVGDGVGR